MWGQRWGGYNEVTPHHRLSISATLRQTQLYIFVYLALPVTELYTPLALHIFVFVSSIIFI